MLPDRVSNPGPLTYESGALPIALRGPAKLLCTSPIRVAISVCLGEVTTTLQYTWHIINIEWSPVSKIHGCRPSVI